MEVTSDFKLWSLVLLGTFLFLAFGEHTYMYTKERYCQVVNFL